MVTMNQMFGVLAHWICFPRCYYHLSLFKDQLMFGALKAEGMLTLFIYSFF